MWSVDSPAEVALIGFGGTLVTAAAGVLAAKVAKMAERREASGTLDRILDELGELRERVGVLEHESGRDRIRPGRRRRPARARPAP